MEIHAALLRFDGKHTRELKEVVLGVETKKLKRELINACFESELQVGATWVFKNLAENGSLTKTEMEALLPYIAAMVQCPAQLHLLQCVQYHPKAARNSLPEIRRLLGSEKAMVRVWALDAFVQIADETALYRKEAKELVNQGLASKAASVRA